MIALATQKLNRRIAMGKNAIAKSTELLRGKMNIMPKKRIVKYFTYTN